MRPLDPPDLATDHSSEPGARNLIARIREFWLARGYPAPELRIEAMTVKIDAVYGVRSGAWPNGLPGERIVPDCGLRKEPVPMISSTS